MNEPFPLDMPPWPGTQAAPAALAPTGVEGPVILRAAGREYRLQPSALRNGAGTALFRGVQQPGGRRVLARFARYPGENEQVRREAAVLARLARLGAPQGKHLPELLGEVRADDLEGVILAEAPGLDGLALRQRLPQGVPPEHLGWILTRLFSVLGFVHRQGVLHGNLTPAHVLVSPADHNVVLLDWTAAVVEPARTGERFRGHDPVYGAPEAAADGPATPAADLFSLGRTAAFLLGGDPATGALPEGVPARLARFLDFLTLPSVRGRAQDAWDMHRELQMVRAELWGPPRFRPLSL